MKRRYQNAFNQLKTSEQLEEKIISTCMKAQPEMTPQLRRRPVHLIPVLTAVVIGIAALGVTAYGITVNVRKQADTYFTQNGRNTDILCSSTDEARIYDDYYHELGRSAVSGDTTLTLLGYISDNKQVYLFGRIIAPSDTVLNEERYDFEKCIPDINWMGNTGAWNGGITFLPYDSETPNQRDFIYEMNYSHNFTWEMIQSITFENMGIWNKYGEADIKLCGTWEFPDLTLTTTYEPIPLLSEPTKISWYSEENERFYYCDLDQITLSLFGIQYDETYDSTLYYPDTCSIYMKDGTVYENMYDNMDHIIIDVSQVDFVQIGDQTFTLPTDVEIPAGSITFPVK